ncbi:hypothetical protein SNEBB_000687 [Seison nebaliae]|nr:hypothetical protein SNEBB_000687 [Seison nebaliae]
MTTTSTKLGNIRLTSGNAKHSIALLPEIGQLSTPETLQVAIRIFNGKRYIFIVPSAETLEGLLKKILMKISKTLTPIEKQKFMNDFTMKKLSLYTSDVPCKMYGSKPSEYKKTLKQLNIGDRTAMFLK